MVIALPALPRRFAGLGVLGLGFCWSYGVLLAHPGEVAASGLTTLAAFAHIAIGGVGAVAASWFGTGAVLYAMTRLVGARPPFRGVLWAYAAAMPPLWIAAPAMAFVVFSEAGPVSVLVVTLASVVFLLSLLRAIGEVAQLSGTRSALSIAMTAVFCASMLSLN